MKKTRRSQSAFTLIEMLVVMGIIAVLLAASLGGYSALTKSAERTKAVELVKNVETALTECFNREKCWPKRLVTGMSAGYLDEAAALPLARGGYLSLSTDSPKNPRNATKLTGWDRFGVLTPWAQTFVRNGGTEVGKGSKIGAKTVQEHILRYALDLDGDGITEITSLGDGSDEGAMKVRATACVWCCGKEGLVGRVSDGSRGKGGVFSFTPAQVVK